MLSLDEALDRVLGVAVPLPAESCAVADAYNHVLAEDVHSPFDLPSFDHSAMDGYAVASTDFAGAPPFELAVRGESRAGYPAPVLERGSACRIFTGAPLPDGADAVVLQENVERSGERVTFSSRPKPHDHVRRRGEDMQQGACALGKGARLGAYELGLLAALDRDQVKVTRRPRVAIICTGDELRSPGEPGAPGTIPESNGPAIAALARAAGATVPSRERVGDEREALARALGAAAANSDVVVTVGGASVGDHDLLRVALADAGASVDFWKVRIKPGKPFLLGALGGARVLGLPGNPVSAQLTFVLFGVTLLRALQGDVDARPRRIKVELGAALQQKPGRLGLYRARLEGNVAWPQSQQASGSTVSLAHADVAVIVPEDSEGLAAGASAEAIVLPRP